MDNTGASVRSSLADELNARRAKLEKLNMLWEDRFVAARERAAEGVVCKPKAVGDWVRTAELVTGKLDARWSGKKRVQRVRGNVVFVDGEVRAYYASQVKRVSPEGETDGTPVETGGGMDSSVGALGVEDGSVPSPEGLGEAGERRRANGSARGFRARKPISSHYSNPGWGSAPSDRPRRLGRRGAGWEGGRMMCISVRSPETVMDIDQVVDMVNETDVEGSTE